MTKKKTQERTNAILWSFLLQTVCPALKTLIVIFFFFSVDASSSWRSLFYIFFILFWTNRQEWTQKKVIIVTKENIVIKKIISFSQCCSGPLLCSSFKKMIYPLLVLKGHEAQYDAHKPLWVIHEYQATNSGWQVEMNIYMDGGRKTTRLRGHYSFLKPQVLLILTTE